MVMLRAFLSLMMFALSSTIPAWAGTAFVRMEPSALLDRAEVRLGDVASVSSSDALLARQLSGVVIARLQSIAVPVRIRQVDAEAAVRVALPGQASAVLWGSAAETRASGRPIRRDLGAAVDDAARGLFRRLGSGRVVEVRLATAPGALELPPGRFEARPDFAAAVLIGSRLDVPLRTYVDGIPMAVAHARFDIRLLRPDVPGPGAGRSAESVAVRRDQPVRLLVDGGGLRIETEGVALDDAAIGAPVKIRRQGSAATLSGQVMAAGMVRVDEN
jgi:hypothetical protein